MRYYNVDRVLTEGLKVNPTVYYPKTPGLRRPFSVVWSRVRENGGPYEYNPIITVIGGCKRNKADRILDSHSDECIAVDIGGQYIIYEINNLSTAHRGKYELTTKSCLCYKSATSWEASYQAGVVHDDDSIPFMSLRLIFRNCDPKQVLELEFVLKSGDNKELTKYEKSRLGFSTDQVEDPSPPYSRADFAQLFADGRAVVADLVEHTDRTIAEQRKEIEMLRAKVREEAEGRKKQRKKRAANNRKMNKRAGIAKQKADQASRNKRAEQAQSALQARQARQADANKENIKPEAIEQKIKQEDIA